MRLYFRLKEEYGGVKPIMAEVSKVWRDGIGGCICFKTIDNFKYASDKELSERDYNIYVEQLLTKGYVNLSEIGEFICTREQFE